MNANRLPRVSEMVAHLDQYVTGQSQAKHALSRALYKHLVTLAYTADKNAEQFPFGRTAILLLGPTGSGKTYLVRLLARFLGLPVSFESAKGLVEAGYVGQSVENVFRNLIVRSGNDARRAERGVVFVDEIDKIRRVPGSERDVSGEGVQQSWLAPLDGQRMAIRMAQDQAVDLDTSRLLFIFAGAFEGLADIIRKRIGGTRSLGFSVAADRSMRLSDDDALAQASRQDLERFGFIPEFIGRFPVVSALRKLTKRDLLRILSESEGNAVSKSQALFRMHGIELTFSAGALEEIADRAERFGTGARGLDNLVLKSVEAVESTLPELEAAGVIEARVTRAVVSRGVMPQLVRSTRPENRRTLLSDSVRIRAAVPRSDRSAAQLTSARAISDTRGWSKDQITMRLDEVRSLIGHAESSKSARSWWDAFERENSGRLGVVLRLAEELLVRGATVSEFFLSYVYSNTDNIQANLHYLDYVRLRKSQQPGSTPSRRPPVEE